MGHTVHRGHLIILLAFDECRESLSNISGTSEFPNSRKRGSRSQVIMLITAPRSPNNVCQYHPYRHSAALVEERRGMAGGKKGEKNSRAPREVCQYRVVLRCPSRRGIRKHPRHFAARVTHPSFPASTLSGDQERSGVVVNI